MTQDHLIKVSNTVDGELLETSYSYDAFSNLIETTFPESNTQTNEYDELGHVRKVTDSLGKAEKTKYDAMGNIVQTVDRNNQSITYEYDARNRLTKRTVGSIIDLTEYDKAGRITKKTRGTEERLYEYYPDGQLKKETAEDGKTIQYEYDVLGRKTKMTDYFSQVFTYSYNNRNFLTGVNSITYEYYSNGMLKKKTTGSMSHWYTYDSANQLTELIHKRDNTEVRKYTYTYDANGNQIRKTERADGETKTESYTYDELNRVHSVQTGGITTAYVYDSNSNILSETTGNETNSTVVNYTYDLNNRLIQTNTDEGSLEFIYNASGNLICKQQSSVLMSSAEAESYILGYDTEASLSETALYEYNSLGQLIDYRDLNGVQVSYQYDLNGLRRNKTYNESTTGYYYDGDLVVSETINGSYSATKWTANGDKACRL